MLLKFSQDISSTYGAAKVSTQFYFSSNLVSFVLGPFIGWLADVKFGRYEIIKFGSLVSFLTSILVYLAIFIGERSTLATVFYSIAVAVQGIGESCFLAAMLPFLTDQVVGATSDELSAVVQWYVWSIDFGFSWSDAIILFGIVPNVQLIGTNVALIFAVPLAVIIISDCLCQQWLDRTHKVTNPIKLIIQVLNYTT